MPAAPRPRRDAEQLALLVESVSDYAIFLLDPSGRIATWNRGAQRIKGYTADDIVGRHFSVFYTDADRIRDLPGSELKRALSDGRCEDEGWRVRKDGTWFWANVIITAVYDREGKLEGFAKVTRDLTERRAAEEALRAAHDQLRRSNEELDRFAVTAAHDLSEPLTTVAGFATLLAARHGDELSPTAREFLSHISRSTERMQQLITTLLEYARAGSRGPHSEPVGVREAVHLVVSDLAITVDQREAAIDIRLDDSVRVLADRSDFELVLRNLISNALKFGATTAPHVTISGERIDACWRITVADDGAGIAGQDIERIFQPFERAGGASSPAGTGLGLAICERTVSRLGGSMGVDSTPGQGSRFWVTLPAADGEVAAAA